MAFEDLKRRAERTECDAPRKVPHIEKAAWMKVLTNRLPGVRVYAITYVPWRNPAHVLKKCRSASCEEGCLAKVLLQDLFG
eukprot:4013336-Amphidinium_carterae.2